MKNDLLCKRYCQENERTVTVWDKIFSKDESNRELIYKTYKDYLNLNKKKNNNPALKMVKNKQTTHHRFYTDRKETKWCSASYIIRESWIKKNETPLYTYYHSSVLAWEMPWTAEPGGPQSMGFQKNWTQLSN